MTSRALCNAGDSRWDHCNAHSSLPAFRAMRDAKQSTAASPHTPAQPAGSSHLAPTPVPRLAQTTTVHLAEGGLASATQRSASGRSTAPPMSRPMPPMSAQHASCRVWMPMEASSCQRTSPSVPRPGTAPAVEAQRAPMSAPGRVTASASLGFPAIPSPRQASGGLPHTGSAAHRARVTEALLRHRSSPAGRAAPAAAPKQAASHAQEVREGAAVSASGVAASGQQPGALAAEEQSTSGTGHAISDALASQACPCTAPLPARSWVLHILQLEATQVAFQGVLYHSLPSATSSRWGS